MDCDIESPWAAFIHSLNIHKPIFLSGSHRTFPHFRIHHPSSPLWFFWGWQAWLCTQQGHRTSSGVASAQRRHPKRGVHCQPPQPQHSLFRGAPSNWFCMVFVMAYVRKSEKKPLGEEGVCRTPHGWAPAVALLTWSQLGVCGARAASL